MFLLVEDDEGGDDVRMSAHVKPHYSQSAAIPYRVKDGRLEVLLITSLKRKRWIIPKGLVEPGLSPAESAAKEALEEAGVVGEASEEPIGTFEVPKWGGVCDVDVYLLRVTGELSHYKEHGIRKRRWVSPAEACRRIRRADLRAIFARIGDAIQVTTDRSPVPKNEETTNRKQQAGATQPRVAATRRTTPEYRPSTPAAAEPPVAVRLSSPGRT